METEYAVLLKKSDTNLLNEYGETYTATLDSKRDAIKLIFDYRFSKRMIRLTYIVGLLTSLLLVITVIQIYLMFKK